MRALFCNIGWMKYYQGENEEDHITSGGSFVNLYHDGGEQYNFLEINGYYYGYVEIKSHNGTANQIHIEKLKGIKNNDSKADNVLVIWVAKKPKDNTGAKVVGWYKNATVFRQNQDENIAFYNIKAKVEDCILLPVNERTYPIYRASKIGNGKGFGQSNIWYADKPEAKRIVNGCVNYILGYCGPKQNVYISHSDIEELSSEQLTEQEHMDKGNDLLNKEDLLESVKHYNSVLKLNPTNTDALYNKSFALYDLHLYDHALVLLKKVTDIEKNADDAYETMGEIYYILERINESKECYDKAIELKPNHKPYLIGEMRVLEYLNYYDKALEICNKIIEIDSNSFDGYFYKAGIFDYLGRYKEAINNYDKCLKLKIDKKNSADINYYMALVYKHMRDYDKALECIQKAISINTSKPCYFELKDQVDKACKE